LADAAPDTNILGPKQVGGTPVTIMVYVEDVTPEQMQERMAQMFGSS
jgi:hypothetical protein